MTNPKSRAGERDEVVLAGVRLWRARKRHDAIDAMLDVRADDVRVTLLLNQRRLWRAEFATEAAATLAAKSKLKELQRAGWHVHW